mgnify:CR=1 FL=1
MWKLLETIGNTYTATLLTKSLSNTNSACPGCLLCLCTKGTMSSESPKDVTGKLWWRRYQNLFSENSQNRAQRFWLGTIFLVWFAQIGLPTFVFLLFWSSEGQSLPLSRNLYRIMLFEVSGTFKQFQATAHI